jgi:hypothetical protein
VVNSQGGGEDQALAVRPESVVLRVCKCATALCVRMCAVRGCEMCAVRESP